ncbi:nuclear transport factor 2 family protein [Flavobacterium sp. NRK1]|uniref:nuclear transport factor 2 family protein n=1 Tax=Flavobacterium sp. NRK1 TaxID=2954929 RepID=UPI0020924604|nr:nuclear transport factor 2 family protein [Flavobacterium sp. NRK1]MCO6146783.1 nuclear transport factor 2 family protein [Flavobacterium sp. NRK1]
MKNLFLATILFINTMSFAQNETYPLSEKALENKILSLDSEAFICFNTCNLDKFKNYFTDDLEFYHDKGGFSKGIAPFLEATRKNICNNPDGKILRKPVAGTLKVYPLEGYGAILTGDHDFYIVNNGIEKKTGTAKFTHVWLLKDGYWKMARVLSYNHHAAE